MTRHSLLILLLSTCTLPLLAQQNSFALGLEFQAYPTGLIPGLRLDYHLSPHHSVHARAGYNWVRHGDNGVQDDEQGQGYGGTLGYRYFFRPEHARWFVGGRADLWGNELDWQDLSPDGVLLATGTTRITVFQPTAEAGYRFLLAGGHVYLAPALAFGLEINVKTEGEPVGEGTILLLGLSAGWQF